MKKTVSLILAAVILLLLVSCGGENNRSYDEAEVKAAAEKLIKRSERLNKIFWGEGIPYVEDDPLLPPQGQYCPADPLYTYKNGMLTVDDLIKEAEAVFSSSYVLSIRSSILSSSVGNNGMTGYTRYYQDTDNMTIMVYKKFKPLLTDAVEYFYREMTVIGSEGEKVTVEIPIKVTRGDLSQERTIKVKLIEEKDGWRIDSPTYTTYREQ
jgi:hypothetical protein